MRKREGLPFEIFPNDVGDLLVRPIRISLKGQQHSFVEGRSLLHHNLLLPQCGFQTGVYPFRGERAHIDGHDYCFHVTIAGNIAQNVVVNPSVARILGQIADTMLRQHIVNHLADEALVGVGIAIRMIR